MMWDVKVLRLSQGWGVRRGSPLGRVRRLLASVPSGAGQSENRVDEGTFEGGLLVLVGLCEA